MHELGIVGKAPERKPRTTDSGHAYRRFPNLVEDLEVIRPEQVWVAGHYLHPIEKGVRVSGRVDGCVHPGEFEAGTWVAGWTRRLTLVAMRRALEENCPEIHHSDQGGAICRDGLRRAVDRPRRVGQHGERGRSRGEWICGAIDADDQGGRGGLVGVRGLR